MPADSFTGFDSHRPIVDPSLPGPFTVADGAPSMRAPRPCVGDGLEQVTDALGVGAVQRVFSSDAADWCRVGALGAVR